MQFKDAGYETLGMGKLWHGGSAFQNNGLLLVARNEPVELKET